MMAPRFRSYVLVSLDQIARNYRNVRGAVGPGIEVMAVVKADAYGHGALEVSRALIGEGAEWLAVSSVDEGAALRSAGITTRILVMAGFLSQEREAVVEHQLTPTAHSLEDIAELDRMAERAGRPLAFHLKIDSGMGRLGTRAEPAEIVAALRALRHARIEGLMTHFASAADFTSPQTDAQMARFQACYQALEEAGIPVDCVHTSSTNAIGYARRGGWYNMVRAGHALYGYVSPARGAGPRQILDVQPALTWKAKILAVKEIPEGTLVGYGGTFRAPSAMRIAILGAGYADGVFHRLSNRGKVIAAGQIAPIVGTISMDLTTIDVSHAPQLKPGDDVTLLGAEGEVSLDAQQIARVAGTISYNILSSISARVRRVYV
ncbi:MAG TPA: alanine racemase [Bryobacteraceae bacterium]|nr:alanine racemase [Bryobacteraceae bacterium]